MVLYWQLNVFSRFLWLQGYYVCIEWISFHFVKYLKNVNSISHQWIVCKMLSWTLVVFEVLKWKSYLDMNYTFLAAWFSISLTEIIDVFLVFFFWFNLECYLPFIFTRLKQTIFRVSVNIKKNTKNTMLNPKNYFGNTFFK